MRLSIRNKCIYTSRLLARFTSRPLCRTNLLTAFLLLSPPTVHFSAKAFHRCPSAGANQRLGDSVCRRGRLLSREQRHCVSGQRGERPPLYKASGSDNAAEYFGNQELAWDPQRSREYLGFHAGKHNYVHLLIILHLLVLLMLHDWKPLSQIRPAIHTFGLVAKKNDWCSQLIIILGWTLDIVSNWKLTAKWEGAVTFPLILNE